MPHFFENCCFFATGLFVIARQRRDKACLREAGQSRCFVVLFIIRFFVSSRLYFSPPRPPGTPSFFSPSFPEFFAKNSRGIYKYQCFMDRLRICLTPNSDDDGSFSANCQERYSLFIIRSLRFAFGMTIRRKRLHFPPTSRLSLAAGHDKQISKSGFI